MKSKKGFTLIELLAIIVILAIIAVITVPIILDIIDNAEKNSSIDSAHGYKDALQKYYATKSIQNPEQELPNGYIEISELPSDFTISGDAPSEGWVKLKKGTVERFSLKYKDYVVTMDNDKNIISEKQQNVEPHVTDDYQEVEYLESNGTQYIDTGYIPNKNTKVDIKFMALDNSAGATPLFGARTSAETKTFTVFYKTSSIGRIDYGVYNDNNPTVKFKINTIHTFVKDKEKNYLDGKYISSNNTMNFSCDYTMYINNINSSNSSFSKLLSSKLYYTKIYDDGNLVRNLVPVIRKNDNKPGMLDLANLGKNLFSTDSVNIELNERYKEIPIVLPLGTYTLSFEYNSSNDEQTLILFYNSANEMKYAYFMPETGRQSVTVSNIDISKIRFYSGDGYNVSYNYSAEYSDIMLNEGTEALPYESYKDVFYTNAGSGEFITGPEM